MATKNKEFYETSEFPALISTLSLNEVMQLQFRCDTKKKWESVAICKDPMKKMTLCNICKVVQYGDKNLFSHLNGKKHFLKMESVAQIRFPKAKVQKNVPNKNANQIKNDTEDNKSVKPPESNTTKKSAPPIKALEPIANSVTKPAAPTKPLTDKPEVNDTAIKSATTKTVATTNSVPKSKPLIGPNNNITITKSSKIKKKPNKISALVPNTDTLPLTVRCEDNALSVKTSDDIEENKNETNSENSKILESKIAHEERDKSSNPDEITQPTMEVIELIESDDHSGTKSSSDANIVLNPLSNAATNERKISCVPLAKLINTEPAMPKPGDQNDNKIVLPSPSPSEIVPILVHSSSSSEVVTLNDTDDKHNNSHIFEENSSTSIQSYGVKQPVTFESSNITEVLGLIGVEYVIKIMRKLKDRTARFLCSLCDINADELSMHNHLLSINHRLKYCEKHFPTALRQYKQYISFLPEHQHFKILNPILQKLAIAIEKHHGREFAYLCYEYPFAKNRQNILSTVFNRRHSSEALGPSFTHVLDSKDIDLLIANGGKINDEPVVENIVHPGPSFNPFTNNNAHTFDFNYHSGVTNPIESNNVQTVDDETHKRMVDMFLRDTRDANSSRQRHSSRMGKRDRSRSPSPDRKRKRSAPLLKSQWNLERRSLSPLRDGDIWQAYRHLVDQSVRDLNTTFDEYKSDPEQHPLYKEEWQKFWKRRKDELIAAGINHRNYNFQSEWILFFNARLEELYNQDVENIKIKCRERLCLPMTNNELANPKYHVNCSDSEPEHVIPDKSNEQDNDQNSQKVNNDNADDINVIHVLRLLTALENYLGSLGPSITEMLAKALQVSKVNPDNINTTILTIENCAILETAKEKFTGLIISKMLDAAQERAIKKAIADTELLLKYAENIVTQHVGKDAEASTYEKSEPTSSLHQLGIRGNTNVSNNKSDQTKKTELAAKLASSLISQGKTKISPDQLKQIIQVYSQIEHKKQQKQHTSASISSATNITNRLSPTMPSRHTAASNELNIQGNISRNLSIHKPMLGQSQPVNRSNYAIDRSASSINFHLPNTTPINDVPSLETMQNYFSANRARTNYTNINNPNEIINTGGYNLKDSQYNHQYDYAQGNSSAQFNDGIINRRNPSSYMMDDNYSFGRTENPREKSNWM